MKLLFDQNISYRIIGKISQYFSGSKHISECGLMNCSDSEVWEYAKNNDYSIVTFDSDFYDISVINGHPPKIIWLRTGNSSTDKITELLLQNTESIDNFINNRDLINVSCLELND